MISLKSRNLYQNVSHETLDIITELNRGKRHTFLIPTKYISPQCAQLGYLLNYYFNWQKAPSERVHYRTFFGNSRFDALQGAIKIARHKSRTKKKGIAKTVFLYDPTGEYTLLFDPLGRGDEKALVPGVKILSELDEAGKLIRRGAHPSAMALCPVKKTDESWIADILSLCREKKIISILEQSDMDISLPEGLVHRLPILPDIIVAGESLTGYQVPFGAFSMSAEVHEPWSQITTCYVHSSTYGGNRLSASSARDRLLFKAPCIQSEPSLREKCGRIEESDSERFRAFAEYVNPGLVGLYALTGLDLQPVRAQGSILEIETAQGTKKIMDCVSGGGAAIRGHTPQDIIPEVIKKHKAGKDYWKALAGRFKELGWPHALPAVSGATAVDMAMTMAMLARPKKTKVVVFKGNYAGKTLLSLTGSEDKIWREPFAPLYFDVVYIDPFGSGAGKKLEEMLCSGEVALVWCELMQGGTGREIPDGLIDIINQNKNRYEYLVGIDEIFMGFYRGDSLFSYNDRNITPDIITLAKPLSDGTFPFAAALFSAAVYREARKNKAAVVGYLEKMYINQFGSHIALHSIDNIRKPAFTKNLLSVSKILKKGLGDIARQSPLIKEIPGKGHFYQLYYNDTHPLVRFTGELGRSMFMLYICRLVIKEAGVFLFFDRFLPSLAMSKTEAATVLKNLERVLVTRPPKFVYLRFFAFMLKVVGRIAADTVILLISRKRK